jgi:hypothetical protein
VAFVHHRSASAGCRGAIRGEVRYDGIAGVSITAGVSIRAGLSITAGVPFRGVGD